MRTKMRTALLLAAVLLLGSGLLTSVRAVELNIDNFGFESTSVTDGRYTPGVAGWTTSGVVGVWDPNWRYFGGVAPEGENVAYINYGGGYIQQNIEDYTLSADTVLTLTGDFGWSANISLIPSFDFALLIGETVLAHGSTTLTPGTFTGFTLTYVVDSLNPYLGLNPTLRITNTSAVGGNPQLLVDNIEVSNHAVPEPSAFLLLGAGILGLGAMRRRLRKG